MKALFCRMISVSAEAIVDALVLPKGSSQNLFQTYAKGSGIIWGAVDGDFQANAKWTRQLVSLSQAPNAYSACSCPGSRDRSAFDGSRAERRRWPSPS
jgi:hypothetical protein